MLNWNMSDVKDPADLTRQQLIDVANEHIMLYNNMIGSGNPNVRVGECKQLQRVWKAVAQAASDGLTYKDMKPWPAMRREIWDAWAESQ